MECRKLNQIQPEYGDEQADAGRDCRTRFARRANGDREVFIFPVQLTTSRIGNLTRLVLFLLYVMTSIHIYIYHGDNPLLYSVDPGSSVGTS